MVGSPRRGRTEEGLRSSAERLKGIGVAFVVLGAVTAWWSAPAEKSGPGGAVVRAAESSWAGEKVAAEVVLSAYEHPRLGRIVTDQEGRVLYVFLRDEPGAPSRCEGACAERWPPLVVGEGAVVEDRGVDGDIGVAARSDGRMQVTYGGMPLYYWYEDEGAGEAKGQGVGGVWFVVPAEPAEARAPTVEVARHGDWGEYMVDTYGRSLYMFSRDAPGESRCYDGCERNWPPFVASASGPTPAGGIGAAVGRVVRRDGTEQVTAAEWPLYYFAGDRRPGDTLGHGFRDVWYVLRPDGTAVGIATEEQAQRAPAVSPASAGDAGGGDDGDTGARSSVVPVAIRGFAFDRDQVTVPVGTTVVWMNADSVPHTVTSVETPRVLDSPVLNQGDEYRYTFTEPGRYEYFCAIHPEMRGVVVVE